MSREVVSASARLLALTCIAVAVLTAIFDPSDIREIRLLSALMVGITSVVALHQIRKRRYALAVLLLVCSLYAASAAGAIGTQVGLRAPSLLVLSMFSLICAFAFPRWLAFTCIGLNVVYLLGLFALEQTGVIDPMAHLDALNSTSVLIVLITLSVIFGALGFPLGHQVDKAMQRMHQSRLNLGRNREMYRSLVEGAPLGIVNFDAEGRITSVNPMFCDWMASSAAEWEGQPIADFIGQPLSPVFTQVGARAMRLDLQLQANQGRSQERWLAVTLSPFPHGGQGYRGGVALFLDDTERKRSELALRQAKEDAEAAAHAKSRFLSHMSHELRTPMTGIIGSIDLARDARVKPEKRERMLSLLDTSARSMLRLIDDILDSARLGEGTLQLNPTHFSPHDLVWQAHRLYRSAAESRGIQLLMSWEGDPALQCVGDAMRLRQVVSILVDNAIRFTDEGHVRITASVEVIQAGAVQWRVWVRDTGVGMTDVQQNLLFRPFTELGLKRAENQRGAGLGLAMAKGLIDMMGGNMGVESHLSQGSAFWFAVKLPVTEARRRNRMIDWLTEGSNES